MNHPLNAKLALYAGRDLPWWERWEIGRHVRRCGSCSGEVERYNVASMELRQSVSQMPAGINWDRLAAEMTANINLGVAAGECVGPVKKSQEGMLGWRAAMVMAAMTCLLVAAWWLNPPAKRQHGIAAAAKVELRTTLGGIEVNENGNTLGLMHTRGRQKPIIVSAPGTLRARFVDDTGQVTINNVYTD